MKPSRSNSRQNPNFANRYNRNQFRSNSLVVSEMVEILADYVDHLVNEVNRRDDLLNNAAQSICSEYCPAKGHHELCIITRLPEPLEDDA